MFWNRFANLIIPILAGLPLGIWASLYQSQFTISKDPIQTIVTLGSNNGFVLLTIVILTVFELVVWGLRNRQLVKIQSRRIVFQTRKNLVKRLSLEVFSSFVQESFGVPCNARYFLAVDDNGRWQLHQVRELAVETIDMPAEHGFSSVSIDNPEIIMVRAFKSRTPIYELLPEDHSKTYDSELAPTIDPRQRWVLACPVLRIDLDTGLFNPNVPPLGVVVFYGTEIPSTTDVQITHAKQLTTRLAEQFAFMDNFGPLHYE